MHDHSTPDNHGKLVTMANQIAAFFDPYGEDAAVAGTAEHINKFWTRSMRRDFHALVATGGNGLCDVVKKSAASIKP